MLSIQIWTPGTSLGHFTAEEIQEIQGHYTGSLVAVIDESGQALAVQPMNPDTGENWETEQDAIQFGERYIQSFESAKNASSTPPEHILERRRKREEEREIPQEPSIPIEEVLE